MNTHERFNIYLQIHKGVRTALATVLLQVGRTDPNDEAEIAETLAAVRDLLTFLREHLQHEDEWIHPALEARRPGSSHGTRDDHAHHDEALAALASTQRAVQRCAPAERATALLRLYRQLALFVAENLEHMHMEETDNHAALASSYSDDELRELDRRLVASIPPASLMTALRWMLPGMTAPDRAALLGGLRAAAPADMVDAVLAMIRPHLNARDWAKLGAAIGPMPTPVVAAAVQIVRPAWAAEALAA